MLNTQYRCHPVIGNLASILFYENSLRHGENTSSIPVLLPSFSRITFINNPSPEVPKAGSSAALLLFLQIPFVTPERKSSSFGSFGNSLGRRRAEPSVRPTTPNTRDHRLE